MLQSFFKYYTEKVSQIPEKELLIGLFVTNPNSVVDETMNTGHYTLTGIDIPYLPWRSPQFVFDQIHPLYDSEHFAQSTIKGIISSSGGLTESTLKASTESLNQYLKLISHGDEAVEKKRRFVQILINLFTENSKEDRVIVPLMKTITSIFSSNYLEAEGIEEHMK